MKNIKNQFKIIVTTIVYFLMHLFQRKKGKCIKKEIKTTHQAINNVLEDCVLYKKNDCENEKKVQKIKVFSKCQVYWHELCFKLQGNSLGYHASG